MSWTKARAIDRINKLMGSIPQGDIAVERFDDNFMARRQQERAIAKANGDPSGPPILKLPYRKAILVDGAHIYANLVNFASVLAYEDTETEASHRQALQFLHLHYAVCDALVREFDIQRVDYHGARVHAVVLTPVGLENARRRAIKAIAFAEALQQLSNTAANQIAGGRLGATLRVGIDSGQAVGINSGRGAESEPLFLGNPANYAAKLAAGTAPGIFLSDQIRDDLDELPIGGLKREKLAAMSPEQRGRFYDEAEFERTVLRARRSVVGNIELKGIVAPDAVFRFYHRNPPLRGMKFSELMPSNTVRMAMISMFADLDGFTRYVTDAIASGNVREMVARLHVTRGEMTHVLRDDFGGKKVRFVGDGLHGVLAEGDAAEIDLESSIDTAVRCAAAMRSSFHLVDQLLGQSSLGLAIGVELGQMPVSRIGHRGEMSVRCATGRAAQVAEDEQQRCEGNETAIGAVAYQAASSRVRYLFDGERIVGDLLYEDAVHHLDDTQVGAIGGAEPQRKEPVLRAHSRR